MPADPPAPADSPTAVPGLARSLAELKFAAGRRACEHCGAREPADWRVSPQPGYRYWVQAPCPRCRTERAYFFRADGDLLDRRPGTGQLGGPEPSTVLTAAELAAAIERLAPQVTTDETVTRDGEGANRNWERHERIRTALTKLAKFIPEGAQEVPGLPGRGVPVPHARPERYTRAWISGELASWSELGRALPPAYVRAWLPLVTVQRDQSDAHRDWLRRGRAGDGRLVLTGVTIDPVPLSDIVLTATRWERVRAALGNYAYHDSSEADLTDVDFSQSVLSHARFRGARFTPGRPPVEVSSAGAVFEHCDLRDTDFAGSDLAGVTFAGCLFRGAKGPPGGDGRLAGDRRGLLSRGRRQ